MIALLSKSALAAESLIRDARLPFEPTWFKGRGRNGTYGGVFRRSGEPHPNSAPPLSTRKELRADMRHRRRSLGAEEREHAASELCRRLALTSMFLRARHLAVYIAHDGEIDLAPLIARAWSTGKRVYLPTLHRNRLWFLPLSPVTPLVRNRFGIPEPQGPAGDRCPAARLDLVMMPLVAFDPAGNRLGMGGGYYDRTFAYLRHRRHWRRPKLVGVAYVFQQIQSLSARSWDVPMTAVATERGVRPCRPRLRVRH